MYTNSYEAPMVVLSETQRDALVLDEDPWVVWVVGGLAWGSALWYSWWCRTSGGWPDLAASWSGFRIACHR